MMERFTLICFFAVVMIVWPEERMRIVVFSFFWFTRDNYGVTWLDEDKLSL